MNPLVFKGQTHPWAHRIIWLIASIGGPAASYSLISSGKLLGGSLFGILSIPAIYILGWAGTVEWNEEFISIRETQFGFLKKKYQRPWKSIHLIKARKFVEHRIPRYEFELLDQEGVSVFEDPLHTDGMLGLKTALFAIANHHGISVIEV